MSGWGLGLLLALQAQDDVLERLRKLEKQNESLQEQVDALKKKKDVEPPAADAPRLKISGYADLGFFSPGGDGRGFVFDTSGTLSAKYPGIPWILLGDPWSTAVNSRGEPADTEGSFALPTDMIDSEGRSSFIVNELNLDLFYSLAPNMSLNASVDFLPRSGMNGELGDHVDVDFAFFQWEPFETYDLELQAGKFASAFGFEYRKEESPARMGITPSLIGRYVSGHPIGLKARQSWFGKKLAANVAIANGSSHIESFPFGEELDSNDIKTVGGRLSLDFGAWLPSTVTLTAGISGEWGAQARQHDNDVDQRQAGFDLELEIGDFEMLLEFVKGEATGGGEEDAQSLEFEGAYALAGYHVDGWVTPYLRWDFRDAEHLGSNFVYVVDISRVTVGVRIDAHANVIFKMEYVRNLEHGDVPSFDNDVFCASLVLVF